MEVSEKLREAGMTRNEAKVYLELLESGKLSANHLAKNLGMDRTLAYTILNHLITKGLVGYVVKEKKKFFHAANPENLLNAIKAKEVLVSDLINELKKIKAKEIEKTEINVYEGKEGLRSLMRKIIKEKQFLAFGGTGRAYDLIYEMAALTKKLEKTKARARILLGEEYKTHEFTRYKNIKAKVINVKSEATTSIFGDCVSIHLIKDKPIVILIKNKHIAQSYKNYFEYMWKKARN